MKLRKTSLRDQRGGGKVADWRPAPSSRPDIRGGQMPTCCDVQPSQNCTFSAAIDERTHAGHDQSGHADEGLVKPMLWRDRHGAGDDASFVPRLVVDDRSEERQRRSDRNREKTEASEAGAEAVDLRKDCAHQR